MYPGEALRLASAAALAVGLLGCTSIPTWNPGAPDALTHEHYDLANAAIEAKSKLDAQAAQALVALRHRTDANQCPDDDGGAGALVRREQRSRQRRLGRGAQRHPGAESKLRWSLRNHAAGTLGVNFGESPVSSSGRSPVPQFGTRTRPATPRPGESPQPSPARGDGPRRGKKQEQKGLRHATPWNALARPAGFEPTTPWFVGGTSKGLFLLVDQRLTCRQLYHSTPRMWALSD